MTWTKEPGRRRGVPAATKRRIMATHYTTCHWCGHGNADEIDHVVNVATWIRERRPGSYDADSNLAPIHGGVCPVCEVACHTIKTQREARHTTRRRPIEPHPGLTKPKSS